MNIVRTAYIQRLVLLSGCLLITQVLAEALPRGEYTTKECIQCHEKSDEALVTAWRGDAHAQSNPVVGCVDCHGARHENTAKQSRRNQTCIQCHGGKKSMQVRSYLLSKHGVINHIEAKQTDWSKPFEPGNYRAPACAYCHMSGSEHNMGTRLKRKEIDRNAKSQQQMRWVCQHCHGPRLVQMLESNGMRMYELGEMKLREAGVLVSIAQEEFPGQASVRITTFFEAMKNETLRALSLGIGHQSPDYQWWHGQPALDGKLLRIKGELTRLRRMQALQTGDNRP